MTLEEMQGRIRFATDLAVIKANVALIKEFLAERKAEVKVAQALLGAMYDMCPHKNTRSYFAMGDYGGNCDDCGKSW